MTTRMPDVAGSFYPSDPKQLRKAVEGYLAQAEPGPAPKALIAPHAGYIYSGPIAATAYRRLEPATVSRVILLGPAHRYGFMGLAAHSATHFATPLGNIPVDRAAIDALLELPQVKQLDAAHEREHSLEVHLPFLQVLLGDFTLVPLVVGEASGNEVAEVLEKVWDGDETLIVISSDLSHFHPYDLARKIDQATADSIEKLHPVQPEQACGCRPIAGLLEVAKRKGLKVETLDLRNSGDTTAGNRAEASSVVGYGAFVVPARS